METLYSIWKRRIVTIPLWYSMCAVFVVTSPIWVLYAVIQNFVKKDDWTLLRTLTFFCMYLVVDCVGVFAAFIVWISKPIYKNEYNYRRVNRGIQRWYATNLFSIAKFLFTLRVDVEGLEAFEGKEAVLIHCRHSSSADTMFPLILPNRMKNMRYVLKAELLADPGLDVVGHRFPNVFVRRGTTHAAAEIRRVAELCDGLPYDGAVVIYPEGTRFTPEKRERLLQKFEGKNEKMYAITQALKKTLSPLRGGGMALTQSMPKDSDVIFIAHRGIDETGSFKDLLAGHFTHSHLEIKVWRIKGEDVPRDVRGSERFMLENWLKVDAWAQGKRIEEAMSIETLLKEHPEIYFGARPEVSLESLEDVLPCVEETYSEEMQRAHAEAAVKAAIATPRMEGFVGEISEAKVIDDAAEDEFAGPDAETALIDLTD